jgi:hypothetical protein
VDGIGYNGLILLKAIIMGMINDLWEIGKDIFDVSDKLKNQSKEKRESLSMLLNSIAEVVDDTYKKLSGNIYPAGNCQQLEVFSDELYEKTLPILGEEKAKKLTDKLKQSHEVEKLLGDLNSGAIERKDLQLLDETSGYFFASAKLLLPK